MIGLMGKKTGRFKRGFGVAIVIIGSSASATAFGQAQQQQPPPSDDKPPVVAPRTVPTPVPRKPEVPPPPSPTEEALNRPITADEAVRIALLRQPNIAIAQSEVGAAQGRTQQVRSGLAPTLNVTAGYNYLNTISGSGTNVSGGGSVGAGGNSGGVVTGGGTGTTASNNGFNVSATARQLLYDFNHTRDLVRQAAALERAASQNVSRVQNDTAYQVKLAYYTFQQNIRLVAVNQANVENRQRQLDLARARLNNGLGQPVDVATAETSVAESVSQLIVARANADNARVNLALQIGIDPRTPLTASDTGEPDPPSTDVTLLSDAALRTRPEVLLAQENIQANRHGLDAAKSTNSPVISGTLGITSRGSGVPPQDSSFVLGGTISFSPFDGGLTAGRVREARANIATAEGQLASARLTVVSDVAQAFVNYTSAVQRVSAANGQVTNAAENVRIAEGRYRSGFGQFLDIINAQNQLLTARTALATASGALEQARAALFRAVGTPVSSSPK